MLRSDAELALDDAVLAAFEASRLYREAAAKAGAGFRAKLEAGADLRERIAEELAEAARGGGWLPNAPDPDAEAARMLADEVQLAVAGAEEAPLETERRLADGEARHKIALLSGAPGLPPPVAAAAERAARLLAGV